MTAYNQDISVYESEDRVIKIILLDEENGSPASITDATEILWRVSLRGTSEVPIFEKTLSGLGGIVLETTNISDDTIEITLDAADTEDRGGEEYYHECRVTLSTGNSIVVASGIFAVRFSSTA